MGNDATIRLGGDAHELITALREAAEALKSVTSAARGAGEGGKAGGAGMGSMLGSMVGAGAIIGGVTVALGAVVSIIKGAIGAFAGMVSGAIAMNASLESTTLQFQTLMGDADAAKEHVKFLFEFAKKTPFETGPIIEASKHLEVMGGAALNTEKNLTLVGDAAAATQKPIEEIAFWSGRAYAAIQAGKPFGEAAARLSEMGVISPKVRDELEKLQKSGADGTVVFAKYQEALGRFSGAMELQANTWSGLQSTLSDTLSILGASALAPVFEFAKSGLKTVVDLLGSEGLAGAAQRVGLALSDAFLIAREAMGPLVTALIETAKATGAAADSASTYETIVRTVVAVMAFLVDAFAWVLTAVATGMQAWYLLRTAIASVQYIFSATTEVIVEGARDIAYAMAAITPGAMGDEFMRWGDALANQLNRVKKNTEEAAGRALEFSTKTETAGASLRAFAGELNTAAGKMRTTAETYRFVEDQVVSGTGAVRTMGEAHEKTAGKAVGLAKSQETLAKSIKLLAEKMIEARSNGESVAEIMEVFGNEAVKSAAKAEALGVKVPRIVAEIRDAMINAKFKEVWAKAINDVIEINRKGWDEVVKDTGARLKKAGEGFANMSKIAAEAQADAVVAVAKKGIDRELAALAVKRATELRSLGGVPAEYERAYGAARAAVVKQYEAMGTEREADLAKEIAGLAKIGPAHGEAYEKARRAVVEKYRIMAAEAQRRKIEEIAGLGPIPEEYRETYEAAVQAINDAFDKQETDKQVAEARRVRDEWVSGVTDIFGAVSEMGSMIGGSIGQMTAGLGQAAQASGQFSTGLDQIHSGNKLAGMASMAQGVMSTYKALDQATNSGNKAKDALGGMMTGMQAGAAFGPWGMAVGAAAGAVFGFVKSLSAGRRAVKDFAESVGGFDALHKRLEGLGAQGEQMWISLTQGTKKGDKAGAEKKIKEITEALAVADAAYAKLDSELKTLFEGVKGSGVTLPASIKPWIDELERAGRITKDNATALRGMTESNAASFGQLQSAASSLGIEISTLGPTFAQQQLVAQATPVITSIEMLINNGADLGAVLAGAKDEINAIVLDSMKFGSEIPGNMKPWIESLAASGELLDANGNKIKDTAGLKFGENVKSDLDDVVDKLQEMIDLMAKGIGGAVDAASGGFQRQKGVIDDWAGHAKQRAREVEDAVTGVAEGHSPSGIKQIIVRFKESMRAADEFQWKTIDDMRKVEDAVEAIGKVDLDLMATVKGGIKEAAEMDEAIAGPDLGKWAKRGVDTGIAGELGAIKAARDAMEAAREGAERTTIHQEFKATVLDSNGLQAAVEDSILPMMLDGLERGRRGSLTRARDLLNAGGG